jgi:hypothetical protein
MTKRRFMSAYSGDGPSLSVGVIGSSAMPQIGQLPGPGRWTSGMHRAGPDRAFWHVLCGRGASLI